MSSIWARFPGEWELQVHARNAAAVAFWSTCVRVSSGDEPDLWRTSLDGEIEQWIDLGQPDESRIRKACGRAREVIVIGYGGRAFSIWWEKNGGQLARHANLSVLEIPADALAGLYARNVQLQCLIQDGEVQLIGDVASVTLTPVHLKDA